MVGTAPGKEDVDVMVRVVSKSPKSDRGTSIQKVKTVSLKLHSYYATSVQPPWKNKAISDRWKTIICRLDSITWH